jgi:hypothetical protein
LLLFPGRSRAASAAEQAGGGDMFPVRRRGKRGGHEDGNKVLSRAILLEILESNYMHILWSNSSNIPMNLHPPILQYLVLFLGKKLIRGVRFRHLLASSHINEA